MVAIKFKGVHKTPGRPTHVEGKEGRRYVNNKILKALETSQKGAGGYKAYTTHTPYSSFEDYSNCFDEIDSAIADTAQSSEATETFQWYPTENDAGTQNVADETAASYEGATSAPVQEGFEIGPTLKACIEETRSYPCVTEHQIRYQQVAESTCAADLTEYFDYPENGMNNLYPNSSDWLEECDQSETKWRRNKTAILRVPKKGVVRSSRGTVELLVHADGRTFKPSYNKCGILVGVHCSDGFTLLRNACSGEWNLFGPDGSITNEDTISSVSFDKRGNLSYQSDSGRIVTLKVDGTIVATD